MSITFWIPDAPTINVDHECWECDATGIVRAMPCSCCNGTGKETCAESTLPEVNMANSNAMAFLEMLVGDAADYCGTWTPEQCATLARKLTKIRNGKAAARLVDAPYQDGIVHYAGRSSEYVDRRSGDLLDVLVAASKAGMSVSWG
jgi:hypothetical protein